MTDYAKELFEGHGNGRARVETGGDGGGTDWAKALFEDKPLPSSVPNAQPTNSHNDPAGVRPPAEGELKPSHGNPAEEWPVSLTGDVGTIAPQEIQREWTPRADGAVDTRTGKPVVDWTPTGKESSSFLTYLKTGFVDSLDKKMEMAAEARFPDLSPADRMARYGRTKGGEIIYLDDDGKIYPETLDTLGGKIKRGVGEAISHMPSGILAGGGEVVGGPFLAGAGGFVGEMGRQAVGKYVFGEEKSELKALGSGALEGAFSFLGPVLGRAVVGTENIRRARRAGKVGRTALRDLGKMPPEKKEAALKVGELAANHGIQLMPHQTFESRSMSNAMEYLAMDIETADAVEAAFRKQGKQGLSAYKKLIGGRLREEADPNSVGASLSTAADKAIKKATQNRTHAVRAEYDAAVKNGPAIEGISGIIEEIDQLIDISKGKSKAALKSYRRDLLREIPGDTPADEKKLAGKVVSGAKALVRGRDRGIRTIRGEIRNSGGINFESFGGELYEMPVAVKRLSNKRGVPVDVMEKDLRSMGYIGEDENLLDLLRSDPEILRRNRPDIDIFTKSEAHLTPSERRLIQDLQYDPEEPVFATLHADDFEVGKSYELIDGQKWTVKEKDDFFGPTLVDQSGREMHLGPDDVAEVVDPKRFKREELLKQRIDDGEISENMHFDATELKQLQEQRKYGKGMIPEDRMEGLDAAKKNMDHFLNGPDAKTSMDKDARRKIGRVNEKLVAIMDEQNPEYKVARDKFRQLSPEVEALQESIVAEIGRLKGDKRTKAISKLYENEDLTPRRLSTIKEQISGVSKEAWSDGYYMYLRRISNSLKPSEGGEISNPMGKIYKAIWNDNTREKLKAAAPSPVEFKNLETLMAIFKKGAYGHGVGSKTAGMQDIREQMKGAVKRAAGVVLSPRETYLRKLDQVIASGDAEGLFKAITSRGAAEKLARINQVSPKTAKFWRLLGAFMGPAVSSPVIREKAKKAMDQGKVIPEIKAARRRKRLNAAKRARDRKMRSTL